jgi:hypothetical protein
MLLLASILGLLAFHSIITSASFVPPYYEVGYLLGLPATHSIIASASFVPPYYEVG